MNRVSRGTWTSAYLRRVGGLILALSLLTLPGAGAGKKKPAQPVNLNTATAAELAMLPGVGPVLARRIVRHREKSGKFRRVEELLVIRGISPKKLEALRPYITVNGSETGKDKKAD